MINGQKIIVVLPAYNAETTLERTWREIPREVVDEVILTDDASHDRTVEVAERLGLTVLRHERNAGYGANQKTCYRAALERDAGVVVMLHPDYQYDPQLVPALAAPVARGEQDLMIGSRFLGEPPYRQGMPLYKYLGNRLLTAWQNWCLGRRQSEYHTGFRAYSRRLLEDLPWSEFSDDFIFDNQLLTAAIRRGQRVGEIACPARYEADSSSINLWRSLRYGWQTVVLAWRNRRR